MKASGTFKAFFLFYQFLINKGIEIDIEILIQNNQVKFAAVSDNFPAQEPSFIERGKFILFLKLI